MQDLSLALALLRKLCTTDITFHIAMFNYRVVNAYAC